MLRFAVLSLLLINGLYFAWSQGLLRAYGFAPAEQREPQRLAQQLRPEAWRLLNPEELRRVETAARVAFRPTECLMAGLFDEERSATLRHTLERSALPAGSWSLDEASEPGRWIVYMGKYPSMEAARKKRAELASLSLKSEFVGDPKLEPGLSLGGFDSVAAANSELMELVKRGVRAAKVVQLREPVQGIRLRLSSVDDTLRARLDEIRPALADKPLRPCP
ncbi:SPOR domain-containing protein [Rhodoferax sp.]|uniref:SPOR domain-containing protein n=1 Tax=Rhodoferax sp. TaxID=50421 RepID=UPI00277951E4|nr:SPOR domain-containing protein [Rhodoferax sp.]